MYNTDKVSIELASSGLCSSAEIKKSSGVSPHNQSTAATGGRRRRRACVTFNEEVVVREIKHINAYSQKEILNIWYRKPEYKMMKADIAATIRKITNGKYTGDTESLCARGLEGRSPANSSIRKRTKLTALLAILEEQERQFFEDFIDEERLADVYVDCTMTCKLEALRRGQQYANES